MLALVTDRTYIEDGVLHMSYLFKRTAVPVGEIQKITYSDDVYTVYGKNGNVAGTMNGRLTGIGDVIHELDRIGVAFG